MIIKKFNNTIHFKLNSEQLEEIDKIKNNDFKLFELFMFIVNTQEFFFNDLDIFQEVFNYGNYNQCIYLIDYNRNMKIQFSISYDLYTLLENKTLILKYSKLSDSDILYLENM